jgi:MFS family permease
VRRTGQATGKLGDRFGHKKIFIIGIVAIALAFWVRPGRNQQAPPAVHI